MQVVSILKNALRMSQFQMYNGVRLSGTCTQTAAAVLAAASLGNPTNHDGLVALMLSMYDAQRKRETNDPLHSAAPNGASTVLSMAYELRQRVVPVSIEWDYAGDTMPAERDWHAVLRENAGVKPILLQIANAQALRDISTGTAVAVNQGVKYHAICVVGKAQEGYIVADGNNPRVEQEFACYPMWAIEQALPCGLIMADVKESSVTQLPLGYKDDGKVLTAQNGIQVVRGFRDLAMEHPDWLGFIGLPLDKEAAVADLSFYGAPGPGVVQHFERAVMLYQDGKKPWLVFAGYALRAAEGLVVQLTNDLNVARAAGGMTDGQKAAVNTLLNTLASFADAYYTAKKAGL